MYDTKTRYLTWLIYALADSDIDLTAPRGKRGDYKLPTYLISETHTVQVMVGSFPQDIKKTRMVESHEPRRPVPPWDNVGIFCYRSPCGKY